MITTTANALIRAAMIDLGAIAAGHALNAGEGADHLATLNRLIDAAGLEPGLLHKLVRTLKTLANGTASYTIGAGADISIQRPSKFEHAGLITNTGDTYPSEIEIAILSDVEYFAWDQKTLLGASPSAVWYDRGFAAATGYGIVYPLPIPNVGTTQLVLYTLGGQVSQFADLTTNYKLQEGVARFLQKNLALEIAPGYPQCVVSQELRNQGAHSRRVLKRARVVDTKRSNSPMLTGGGTFDMNSGRFR